MKLYGRNSILERLKTNAKSVNRIFLQNQVNMPDVVGICKSQCIPIDYLAKNDFEKKARDIRSQGVIAEVEEFQYSYLEDVLALPKEKYPVILFLDSLNDPQNLGSILRTAGCFGGFAVVLPKHDSVEVTEAVLRVAQGGENYVPVIKVTNLAVAVDKAKKAGYWVSGAVMEGGDSLTDTSLNFPLGVIIGSEGFGIRPGLINHIDFKITLPMKGAALSFNAAVAAALFCYEVTRQRASS